MALAGSHAQGRIEKSGWFSLSLRPPLQGCWEGLSPSNVRIPSAYNRQPEGGDVRVR
jgi:hypothetical protein